MRRLLPAALAVITLAGPLVLVAGAGPAVARDDPAVLPAMQVVVLVDESGSLTDADVDREREAARTIAFSVLAPDSELSVVGFGSSNGPGQSAIDVVCEPTVLSAQQDRDALATCVSGLQRRTPQQGADTDHAAALQQALSYVRAGKPAKKVVFLLTDGVLDVANSPAWGDTRERRNAAARAAAKQVLDKMAAVNTQVWPLGFGSVDQAALSGFARGKSCTPAAGDPQARMVPDSSKLTAAVAEAFSSAGCVKYSKPDIGDVPRNGSEDLHGTIPAIASEASILVYKRDKRVQVEYWAPGASKPAPAEGGSKFEQAGQSTDMETLKISDPVPGEWRIRLSSAGAAAEDVTATVVYQAAVRAYLTVNPPRPEPGQDVNVEMQIWARNRAVTDAEALSALTFAATMTGAGVTAQKIVLGDADHDGTFTGRATVPPAATGDLMFTGQVSGIGIGGDTRVLNTKIQKAGEAVQASILFDVNRAEAHPGSTIPGKITVRNDSAQPARLRFAVADPSAGGTFAVDPPVVEALPGNSTTEFTLSVGKDSAEGTGSATLRLVNDATSDLVTERLFAARITPVPSLVHRYRWLLLGLAVVLLLALALLAFRLRSRHEARKVRGLAVLLFAGSSRADEMEAADPDSTVLRFTVGQGVTGPYLQPASARDPDAYQVRRDGVGLTLTAPDKSRSQLAMGARRRLGPELSIAVLDSDTDAGRGPDPGFGDPDPFPDTFPTTPIPEQRATANIEMYPPAQDPFTSDPDDPFGSGFPSPGPSSPTASPAGGNTAGDPNNPFT